MIEFLEQYSGALMTLSTFVLVSITAFYAYWTKGILHATSQQSKLSLNPVIGISIKKIGISKTFGPNRRNLSVDLELTNVGNAPAIEVLVDAEFVLRHSEIEGHKTIPSRFEPDVIPFIKSDQTITECSPNFGNKLVTHFFDDVMEAYRLNMHRIKTEPSKESFKASRLRILTYYRNSLGQHYKSYFEIEVNLRKESENFIPKDDERSELQMLYVPRPVYQAETVVDEQTTKAEIQQRNKLRKFSGW